MKILALFILFLVSFLTVVAADPTPELAALREQAMGGDAAKIFAYAEALRKAESEEAFEWYVKAADRGHPQAAFVVFEGSFADNGQSISKADYDRLLGYLRRAAEGGHAPAQHRLGVFLESYLEVDGKEVATELEASARWYRKAAEQKHTAGMEAWALAELAGIGVPKDFAAGLRDMKAAAQAGGAKAQRYLADLYKSGEDPHENKVPVDWAESIRWSRMMIAAGDEGELLTLAGSLLNQPNPSEADIAEARKLIEAQVAGGNPNAQEFVELLAKKSAAAEEKARWEKVEARYAIFEKQFTGATSALGRRRALWKYRQWIQSQPYGIEWSELGEWSLRRMTPLLERHPNEAFSLLESVPRTVISRETVERVLPGSLLTAIKSERARFAAAYDADEKYRAEIRQKYQAAYKGDGAAQLAVALAYLKQSDGRESQWAHAMHWLTLAKANGVPGAGERLAKLVEEVNGRLRTATAAKDQQTLAEIYRQKADSPMADASDGGYRAGQALLANGRAFAEDIPDAETLLKAAADKGHVEAMLELGKMHLLQEALPADESKALPWFTKAAERDNPEAKAWVKVLTPKLGPAERGALAQEVAGERMRISDTAISFPAAMPFSAYAARLGNEQARAFLVAVAKASSGQDVAENGPTTLEQDQAGAKAGDAESMRRLGERYEVGDGVPMDDGLAYDWFRRAAERGSAQAKTDMEETAPRTANVMYRLAERYETGNGVAKDLHAAWDWYDKAAKAGHEDAEEAAINVKLTLDREGAAAQAGQLAAQKKLLDGAPLTKEDMKKMSGGELLGAYQVLVERDRSDQDLEELQAASMAAFLGDTATVKKNTDGTLSVVLAGEASPVASLSADAALHKARDLMSKSQSDEAAKMIRRAAEMAETASAESQYFLAGVLLNGLHGVTKDPARANAILIMSAKAGYVLSQIEYAKLLVGGGHGVTPDRAKAEQMFFNAVSVPEQKSPEEKMAAAMLLARDNVPGVTLDRTRAFRLVESAADAGLPIAQIEFGRALFLGTPPVVKDQPRGVEYLKKAADKMMQARLLVGQAYEQGIDGKANVEEALRWYDLAGNIPAARARAAALREKHKLGK